MRRARRRSRCASVRPSPPARASTTAGADSNWTSLTAIGCGSSTCSHMPGLLRLPRGPRPDAQRVGGGRRVVAGGRPSSRCRPAPSAATTTRSRAPSTTVLRLAVAARTRATSPGVIIDERLPNALRMYEPDRGDPVVRVLPHRDHHFGVGHAADRAGQAVQQGLDGVVAVAVHARRGGQRRGPRAGRRTVRRRRAAAIVAMAGEAQLLVDRGRPSRAPPARRA